MYGDLAFPRIGELETRKLRRCVELKTRKMCGFVSGQFTESSQD